MLGALSVFIEPGRHLLFVHINKTEPINALRADRLDLPDNLSARYGDLVQTQHPTHL